VNTGGGGNLRFRSILPCEPGYASRMNSCRNPEIGKELFAQRLNTLFQPIIDVKQGAWLGYEALTRGPADSHWHMPDRLFQAATQCGCLDRLEKACVALALSAFRARSFEGRLFLNLSCDTLMNGASDGLLQQILELVRIERLRPNDIVIELTEQQPSSNLSQLAKSSQCFREAGFALALDDLGEGYASLKIWSTLKPDFIKIDRHFINGIDQDAVLRDFVQAMTEIARSIDCEVIAEGVETASEARIVTAMGIRYLQGWYFARPREEPVPVPMRLIHTTRNSCHENEHVHHLVTNREWIAPDTLVKHVARRFHRQASLQALAVVGQDGTPVGLINRHLLLEQLSRPYLMDLFARKPIETMLDTRPIVIEGTARMEQASRLVTSQAKLQIYDHFIVTEKGRFYGVASVVDLLRAITELQVKSARHANPLTLLPGNAPINETLRNLLSAGQPFTVVYVDLDHFKPYNDEYGYASGDQMLLLTADIFKQHCQEAGEFVGHVGGDDFVLIFQHDRWLEKLKLILSDFHERRTNLYHPEHVQAGGFQGIDRFEQPRFFPLVSISMAAMPVKAGCFDSPQAISSSLSSLKHQAKEEVGSVIVWKPPGGETMISCPFPDP